LSSGDRPEERSSKVIQEALAEDEEQHRVMYQYMFVENKKRKTELIQRLQSVTTDEQAGATGEGSSSVRYLSTLNTRRNPDLLVPGGKFLKGNHYFKGND
jgi:hypothetical protein